MANLQEAIGKQSRDVDSVEAARLLGDADEAPANMAKGHTLRIGGILIFVNVVVLLLLVGLAWHLWAANAACDCSAKALSTYCTHIRSLGYHHLSPALQQHLLARRSQPIHLPARPESRGRRGLGAHIRHARVSAHARRGGANGQGPVDAGESLAGPREYMGMVDFFRQAHCLDNLRRAAFPAYYNVSATRAAFAGHPFPFDDHLLYCQYILLEALMCHADVEVVTYNKLAGVAGPFANFAVGRTCRDFDAVLDWKERHSVVEVPRGWQRFGAEVPEGIVELDPWDTRTPLSG